MDVDAKVLFPLILHHNYVAVFLYEYIYNFNICKRQIFNRNQHINITRVTLWQWNITNTKRKCWLSNNPWSCWFFCIWIISSGQIDSDDGNYFFHIIISLRSSCNKSTKCIKCIVFVTNKDGISGTFCVDQNYYHFCLVLYLEVPIILWDLSFHA